MMLFTRLIVQLKVRNMIAQLTQILFPTNKCNLFPGGLFTWGVELR